MTTLTVADHMRVEIFNPDDVKNQVNSTHVASALFNYGATQHVSMTGANTASFVVTLHEAADALASPDQLVAFVQESNELSNWYEIAKTADNQVVFDKNEKGSVKRGVATGVSMAYVRVIFVIDDTSSPGGAPPIVGTYATVSCVLSTSKL